MDAQGNQLSMYDHKVTDNAVVNYLADRNIYGSSRLGSLRDTVNMFIPTNLPSYGVVGNRNYELSNHLGNVLAVVNDIVYPISDDSTTILSYEVGLTQVSDYSPFGVQLDGRTIQNEMYSQVSSDTSSQTTPIIAEIYKNEFDSPPATTSPYTGATTTLDGNLSNPVWTSSTGDFTNYNSTGAGSGKSIAIQNASPDTSYVTLSLDVDSGYLFDITSYSFAHRSSSTGYDSYKLVVNGIEIGTGSIFVASSGSTLQSTGVVNVSNVVSGVTGTVNVVLKLYGGLHGSTGTFRMDDFILNGYTQEENAGNGSGNGYVVMGGYRYGFNGMEKDDEVKGNGNSYDFGARIYDPRVGRFLSLDPKSKSFPFMSPYCFADNNPIRLIDVDGEGPGDPMHHTFLTTVAIEIFSEVKAVGASNKGALLIIAQASLESGYGSAAITYGDFNLFGVMTNGDDFKRKTSHGKVKDYSKSGGYGGAITDHISGIKRKWPKYGELIKMSEFGSDEIDAALYTGEYIEDKQTRNKTGNNSYNVDNWTEGGENNNEYGTHLYNQMKSVKKRLINSLDYQIGINQKRIDEINTIINPIPISSELDAGVVINGQKLNENEINALKSEATSLMVKNKELKTVRKAVDSVNLNK